VLFLPDGGEAALDTVTGEGTWKRLRPRPLLFGVQRPAHLNHIKGVWTYVADAYALILLILAVTGLFVLKGENGLWGRGKWWVLAGTFDPAGVRALLLRRPRLTLARSASEIM